MGVEANQLSAPAFDDLEIVVADTVTLTRAPNNVSATATFTHNLGYVPFAMVFQFDGTHYFPTPLSDITNAGLVDAYWDFYTDNKVLTVRMSAPNIAGSSYYAFASTIPFKFLLMRSKAST